MKLKYLRGLLVIVCFALYQSAKAYDFKFDGKYYNILSKSGRTVEVTCLSEYEGGYSGFVRIPSNVTYNGVVYTVVAIGGKAFKECNPYSSNSGEIKAITIPKTIKSIGSEAFRNSSVHELQVLDMAAWCNVSCDDSPFMVGAELFFEGRKVNNLIIPSGVTSISTGVFKGCKQLETVLIPQGVVSIGNGAFRFCEKIKSLSLPSSVAYIGNYAFDYCENLTTLEITNPNVRFEENTFANCKSLTTLIIPNDMQIDVDAFFSKCEVKKGCYTVKRIGNSPLTPLHETKNSLVDESDVGGIITSTFIENIQKYKGLGSFHDGLARVGRNGKYGYMNIKGEEVIPCSYTDAYDFSNGVARVIIDGKTKYIDINGNVVPSPNTQSSGAASLQSSNGLSIKEVKGKYGYADASGKIVIPCKYDGAKPFRNGYAAVEQYEYINGAPVMSVEYDPHWGVIDEKGKVIIPFNYDFFYYEYKDIPLFSEGMAIVRDKTEQFGYYDENGKKITPCKYTEAQPFSNGVAFVKFKKKLGEQGNKERYAMYMGYVDKNGKEALVQCEVKEGTIFYEDGMKYVDFTNEYKKQQEEVIQERERVARGEAEEQIRERQKYEREIKEQKQREVAASNNWLYGTWRYDIEGGAYLKLTINASQITETFYMPSRGEMTNVRSYYVDGNRLYTDKTKYKLDRTNKRLLGDDGSLFKKVSNSTTSANRNTNTYGKTNANSSVNTETNNRIARLERKAQDDINELNAMVSSGRMHPVTLMSIKQNLPDELLELMNYYRNQGNSSKYEEYAYKRRVVVQILREIGI